MSNADTRETILAAARLMVQANGYSALSFRELAKQVGIKSASIHYHFPTKGDLAGALARRYADDAVTYFDGLLAKAADQATCIRSYTDVFRATLLNDNRMCLWGIMAAERDGLDAAVRAEVDRFTEVNIHWLAQVLALKPPGKQPVRQRALAIFAAIEGAMLLARGRGDILVFDHSIAAYRTAGLLP
jgi:TetR/AcrR family transcriptional repressor of nem operon